MASDYLWDRSGPVDPEVEELESELSQLSCEARDRSLDPPRMHEPTRERTLGLGWLALAAALAVGVGAGYWLGNRQPPRVAVSPDPATAPAPQTPGVGSREECPPCPEAAPPEPTKPPPKAAPPEPTKPPPKRARPKPEVLDPWSEKTPPKPRKGDLVNPWSNERPPAPPKREPSPVFDGF